MRLLDRYHWSARIGLWIGAAIGAAGFYFIRDAFDGGMTLILTGVGVYLGVPRASWWWLWRDADHRFRAAQARDDMRGLRATFDEMREAWPKGDLAFYESVVLLEEERWADAHEILSAIDRRLLGDAHYAVVLNRLAWSLVELGRGEEAIVFIEEALPLATDELRPFCTGTLGAALVVASRPAEGIRHLEEALRAENSSAAAQAARAFYLAEGLRALGRGDEARAAYQRAADEKTSSGYVRRARQQLEALPTAPHR